MNKNNMLTRFDEGKSHEQNALGGIPIGNNNSVEQGETKQDNFIYSNRIFLDSNTISQYNLPKSLIGKSVADATKFIDNKFKGRNDKISQSTKNLMLSKIAEAQEAMKPQEPEMIPQEDMIEESPETMVDPYQMALGGCTSRKMYNGGFSKYDTLDPNSGIGYKFNSDNANATNVMSSELKNASNKTGLGLSSALSGASTALELGNIAFGKPSQNTDGLAASEKVDTTGMIGGSALKGAQAGMALGPIGAGVGAVIGGVAGLIGSKKAKKAAFDNTQNFAINTNRQFSEQYAMGGEILNPIDPIKILAAKQGISSSPVNENPLFNTKRIVKYQPGVTNDKLGRGFYLYSKDNTQPGFDPNRDREFIKQSEMLAVQRTPEWKEYMLQQSLNKPQTTFADGGPIKPKWINDSIYTAGKRFNGEGTLDDQTLTNNLVKQFSASKGVAPGQYVPLTTSTINPYLDKVKSIGKDIVNYTGNNIGNLARYTPVLTNALQLKNLQKPQAERLDRLSNRYKPEYVDEAMMRNIVDQEANNQINALTQSGASQGAVRNAILGAGLNKTKALSDAYMNAAAQNRATNDRAQTFNLGVDQVNLNQSNTERENYARDKGNYDTQKSKLIGQLGNDIGNIGKEEIYKKIAKTTTGYSWLGEYQKMNPNATPEETKVAAEKAGVLVEDNKTTKKNALGGYLIKNKK